jgi:class 3 adenylate cyclase
VRCTDCGTDNREGRKFCAQCGVRLVVACPACRANNEPGEKFCGDCGNPLTEPKQKKKDQADTAGARKIVTILFADLVGSTALHERLDPESARRFMESYYGAAREAVESHGGVVAKLLGDGAMAVFGIPRVAEDDAIRAVRAGVAMQQAFRALAEQQRDAVGETGLRVAVNTGEVVVKGETEIIGDPVNVAARLQERARDGDVVVGESTQRLVASLVSLEPMGSFDLKGRAEAVRAYRVLSIAGGRHAGGPTSRASGLAGSRQVATDPRVRASLRRRGSCGLRALRRRRGRNLRAHCRCRARATFHRDGRAGQFDDGGGGGSDPRL